ncbi:MAG: hypothetical protein J5645_01620 [Lachnospiraceae bacterium]|nr:hypothetical protein [Lachnospiraceae bacterium]
MKEIDVFECYYEASCVANGRPRHAASVKLTATSDAGMITYTYSVNFFPHDDEEDFAISYDAYVSKVVFEGKGRRSKKKEVVWLDGLEVACNGLADRLGGTIDWEKPLITPRRG